MEKIKQNAPLILLLLGGLFFIKFFNLGVLISPFLAVLVAIGLLGLAQFISSKTKLSTPLSLMLILSLAGVLLLGFISVAAVIINTQFTGITEKIADFQNLIMNFIESNAWSQALFSKAQDNLSFSSLGSLNQAFSSLGILFFTFVAGIFMALNPAPYVTGLRKSLNIHQEKAFITWKDEVAGSLKAWLKGKLIAMFIISVVTAIGLSLIGVEFALTLGLIAGLLSFIPNIGPVLALIPAVVVAYFSSPETVWWVLGLFAGVQTIESYVLMPLINQKSVEIPPAFTLVLQIFMGTIFGFWGLIIAAPFGVLLLKSWPYLITSKNS